MGKSKMTHRIALYSWVVLLILVSDVVFSSFGLSTFAYQNLEQSIQKRLDYPGSQTIYSGWYTGGNWNIKPKIGYVWTSDEIDTVKAYYEKILPKFEVNYDEGGAWWQTQFTNQPSLPQKIISIFAGLPDSLVDEGVSVALLDLTKPTVPFSPQYMTSCNSCIYFYADPPMDSRAQFEKSHPSYGTWIIYRYYVYVPYLTFD